MEIKKFTRPVVMLALCSLTLASCKKSEDASAQQGQIPELAVMTVGTSEATIDRAYPATLVGDNDVEIRPQITGQITQVLVEDGEHVSKGQLLFVIDAVQLQAAVDAAQSQVLQAQAGVVSAQASVNTAQTNVNNNKLLLDKNIISASAYQITVDQLNMAKAQLNQAQASVRAAQAQLASANKNLSYSRVTAPVSGVVGTIDFKQGAYVTPQSMLTVLSTTTDMEARFSLTEKELLAMTEGSSLSKAIGMMPPVQLQLADGTIYPLSGKITAISGVNDTSTGSARVTAMFPNPNGLLRAGSTAKVLIPNVMNDVISVPQKATFEIQDMKYVFVVTGDSSKLVSTNIKVSPLSDGKNYFVTEGLNPGDKVLVEGVGVSAKEGMPIKPKAYDPAAAAQAQ